MDTQNLMVFENEEFGAVRTRIKDGEPWFAAADVCRALEIGNPRQTVQRLEEDEKMTVTTNDGHSGRRGGAQRMNYINEPGLYSLILTSRKPEAKAFKRWITHEVIPSIRRHGAYMADRVIRHLEENPDVIPAYLKLLREGNAKAKELGKELAAAKQSLSAAQPKADYYDAFITRADTTSFRLTAKELGVPERRFISYLLDNKYLYRDRRRGGRCFVRAGSRNAPLFVTRECYFLRGEKVEYTLITAAGKDHFRRLIDEISRWEPKKYDGDAAGADLEDCPCRA